MPITEPLERYVVAKVGRLDRYLDRLSEVNVVLAAEKTREASRRNQAEATAMVRGRVLRAEAADADMYAAVDEMVDKLHQQLVRLKERTRSHKGVGLAESELGVVAEPLDDLPALPEDGDGAQEDGESRIVEVNQSLLKPMFPDEAIDELEQLGYAFFVFLNAQNERVSVLYRRRDGSYGLIEPVFE